MRGRGWMIVMGCMALMVLGLVAPVLASDFSDEMSVSDLHDALGSPWVTWSVNAERPESAVPPDPGSWVGTDFAIVKPKTQWCKIDNAEAAVPVDPGSVSYEPTQDYSGSKLIAIVGGVVGLSLYFGCYTIRS